MYVCGLQTGLENLKSFKKNQKKNQLWWYPWQYLIGRINTNLHSDASIRSPVAGSHLAPFHLIDSCLGVRLTDFRFTKRTFNLMFSEEFGCLCVCLLPSPQSLQPELPWSYAQSVHWRLFIETEDVIEYHWCPQYSMACQSQYQTSTCFSPKWLSETLNTWK